LERSVRLRLLGRFDLVCDGERISLPDPVGRLLAYLAVQDRPVRRDRVARALWPDADPSLGPSLLAGALWPLRRPGLLLVVSVGDHLSVVPELTTDLREAEETARRILSRRGRPLLDGADREVLSTDLLPGWSDPWAAAERRRFRELRLAALARVEGRWPPAARPAD
jgi:DNA-binding SARP family transcriptional activator